ncbi:hypothetical protein BT96DRAFT_1025197 [Gymnopus androsaceus JB14]|uniref:F-box domain-containing protein n=1 Tax=Gymnopus androsaceus JB14 TaxID=1447944 RepID=A0A6A4GVE3_9AGAR|nr:hypothetical protein BT96DRAFT_1025197 [Gymnopus androsaceus JB14]
MAHFLSQPRIDGPIYLGPGDISFLRAQISEAESQVESLEKGLKRLYEEPKISELELELERRKKEKLVEIASFQNILSPIRRAPQELLSEIFELSCVLEGSWKSELDTVTVHPPFVVMMLIDVPELRHVDIAFDNSTIPEFDPAVYVDLLPRCKVLVHLDICWPDLSGRFPTFLLPTLKSLRVSCHQVDSHGTSLLSCFTSPLLEELTLYHYGQNVHQLFADLVRFQRRSATALSTLTLQYFRARHGQLKPEDWTAALSLSREIKALHLETCSFNVDPLLQALTYTKEHHNLLPKLTKFYIALRFFTRGGRGANSYAPFTMVARRG